MRPPIVFISIFGATVGALNVTIARGLPLESLTFALALLAAGTLAAGLMVHNDFADLASDRVNRPHKPIPSGIIKPETAKYAGIIFMLSAVCIAFLVNINSPLPTPYTPYGINLPCGLLTATVVLVGVIYNNVGKYIGIAGHIIVAFGVGCIPYWGAVALRPDDLLIMLPLALSIFVMEIGREIMVSAGDIRGDIKAGFSTTPVRIGRKRSLYLVLPFYMGFLAIYPIPYFGWFGFTKVFGELYLTGATAFALVLFTTWYFTFRAVNKYNDDEEKIWNAFEINIRTGTRVGVIFFQILLFLEAFC